MKDNVVYLGLGGNIGDSYTILNQAIQDIQLLEKVTHVETSAFYKTDPIGGIPQDDYLNMVCRLHTSYSLEELFKTFQAIEINHGKIPKPKNFPRKIDIDILFFNDDVLSAPETSSSLNIPHLRWKERLFVLIPLLDLMQKNEMKGPLGITCKDLEVLIERFTDTERQKIIKV